MYFTSNDGFQNFFVYQPTFITLKHKITSSEYIVSWKSKGQLEINFLSSIKYLERKKIGILFNNAPIVSEQNKGTTKNVNVYIVHDLDNWPNNPLRNFSLKIVSLERLIQ